MRSGQLRHLVSIEQLTETVDANGGVVKAWAEFATAYASIEPITGREYFASSQITDVMTNKIKIRYQDGIIAKMRVNWGGRLYNIEAVVNVFERDRELYLLCTEGQNDG